MKILGIDPGTATIGYGVVEAENNKASFIDMGIIATSKTLTDAARLHKVHKGVKLLIKKYKPQIMVIEQIYFSKNIKTAIGVAQARGVVMLSAQEAKIKILECNPQDVKMSVAGYGNADKKQVQKMVQVLLKLKSLPQPDDAADALAAALYGASRAKLEHF